MSEAIFDPSELRPVKDLVESGAIRLSYDRVRKLCQKDRFPAVKIANQWHTTPQAARSFHYKGANKAFRRIFA